ncbi:hypothetical protein SARC_10662 [Sphaeroforma arctica JP610]|uniref:Smr domain-containing protein n=1 Tax=Sphaeroforma arctica JP610 TaxID=667725 RepID=A0A0L0FJ96_9EUKA|nr:hypothetical protein SARC_10662 [Sphaeroforma arctica JP610]KNC76864.1 hypothetical protein SARC_10662 [Sphaeroforma arctica JP610]|eukprot:XP_014150766.1 hypothetical protein SARC_10662 [Sphaeroforma arctica JP610]
MNTHGCFQLYTQINTYKGVTPVEYIENRFEANGRDYQDTLKELSELYPAVPTNASGSQKPSWSIAGSQPAPRSTAGKGITRNDPAYDASWKSAGKDVNALYTRARGEAVGHSRLRGQYFQRAAEAYRSGNRQGAAAFSKEGRMHHDLALKLQREACELIFSSRNTRHSPEVDLHGLHVSEALELLEGLLGRAAESNEYICIITGTGRHSVQGRARLRPAVEKYLTNHGYSYTDASTDQRGGMIKVKL